MSVTLTQPIRFVLVGAAGYGVNLAAFAVLYGLGTAYVAASVAAYLVSNALMYLCPGRHRMPKALPPNPTTISTESPAKATATNRA